MTSISVGHELQRWTQYLHVLCLSYYTSKQCYRTLPTDMDYLQVKWKLWFNALDVNHDGALSKEDMQDSLKEFQTLHAELEDAERQELKRTVESWWEKYIFQGRTGKIMPEEFVAGMTRLYLADKAKFIEEYTNCEKEIFNFIDTNHDRCISEEEYITALKSFGHKKMELDKKFFQAHKPENGLIPIKKGVAVWVQLLTCEDKSKEDIAKTALEGGL